MSLVEQGHEVHVAYQTSGNIAVHDHDALRFIEFFQELGSKEGFLNDGMTKFIKKTTKSLQNKQANQSDIIDVRQIKGLIRRGEARAGARFCGIPDKNIHFLDMPFYETGSTRKNDLSEADIKIVANIMEKIQPHQVYAAGDLADPHGTHRVCLDAIIDGF